MSKTYSIKPLEWHQHKRSASARDELFFCQVIEEPGGWIWSFSFNGVWRAFEANCESLEDGKRRCEQKYMSCIEKYLTPADEARAKEKINAE